MNITKSKNPVEPSKSNKKTNPNKPNQKTWTSPKPNLQQTLNPKCLETITSQTNNNNKPCNPNQRTQSNPAPTKIFFSKPRSDQT